MLFELTILGSSSATPTVQRHPTAQVLNINEKLFLVDCGEGTQMQLLRYRVKFNRINHIFISHLHGDHFFGLMGLLSTMHLQGRTAPLTVYGPEKLEDVIRLQLQVSETNLRYPLIFYAVSNARSTVVYEDHEITVESILLKHRIPCAGYLFREKPKQRKLDKDKIAEFNLPVAAFNDLKEGRDYTGENGRVYLNSEFTKEPRAPRSYAYCSDTIYDESIVPQVSGVDMLYHEATFQHDMLERANETFHTTALQAGQIAEKAQVKRLLIGHFSARYSDLFPLLSEARSAFSNTSLAIEGEKFTIE